MDDNDWDLFAVVRGCTTAAPEDVLPLPEAKEETRAVEGKGDAWWFLDASAAGRYELNELCKPFYAKPGRPRPPLLVAKPSCPSSATEAAATSVFPAGLPTVPYRFQPLQPRQTPSHRPVSQTPRSKRSRKNQQKKVVCQVPADGVSSDMWAWRKYGQKPIKGSPYPRGYYRCSSSKGCQARKQVERSRADPGMLVITYTAEHNHPFPTHRNSLSGSTRQKLPPPPPPPQPSSPDSVQLPSSSPAAAPSLSPTWERGDEEEEDEEEEEEDALTVGDVEMMGEEEMLFLGMEVIDASSAAAAGAAGVEKSPATVSVSAGFFEEDASFEEDDLFRSPWLAKNSPAAAAGGG